MGNLREMVPLRVLVPVVDENRQQVLTTEGEQLFLWRGRIHAAAKPNPIWSFYGEEWDMLLWVVPEDL